ncbi:MAG: phytanoyl-CoA dioxygenase family protein [Planctomycetes bacterium]|nr:phytanoyl-CoA dioxygenase family protein [Planctomycetota bacterium]
MPSATATAIATAPAHPVSAALAGRAASPEQIAAWVAAFHRDGYVFIEDVLTPDHCALLRDDMDRVHPTEGKPTECDVRMFERSRANLDLFDLEPLVGLAETILGEDRTYGKETCHVMHNNCFRTRDGGGFSGWHQDDSSHFVVTHGEAPTNIHLPCLLLTCNYYLTDQTTVENGPGQVIPGSHKLGAQLPSDLTGTEWEPRIVSCTGRMGSVMVFNNQVWHRGAPNRSDRTRYVTQVSYGRKLVSHMYAPFMNYQMPEHCLAGADARRRRLLGFLPCGAYG